MNANTELWDLRVDKIVADLKEGRRPDGRKIDEVRKVRISNKVSENADGAARVQLGDTDVIAGVKMAIGEPYPDSPGEGSMTVGVELLPIASPEFEIGPPSKDSIELARVVDRGIRESKSIDFRDLCISEGKQVWIGFVDLYIINDDGNLFDACGIAALGAMLDTSIPKQEDGKIIKGEYAGKLKLRNKPILSTFGKIGSTIVADPVTAEEKAMAARFSVTVTEDDNITAFQKGLAGSFKVEEINAAIDVAMKNSKQIRKLL